MNDIYLCIEFGSICTKAMLIEASGSLRLVARGEALTTAGYCADDVSLGLEEALRQLSESYQQPLLSSITPLRLHPDSNCRGILAMSSVAGGSVGAVGGVFRDISAESAQRAVLLSGACVSDVFAINDNRLPHEKRVALKQRPVDFVFLAGGVDELDTARGAGTQTMSVARILSSGLPRSPSDPNSLATVVYGGSVLVRDQIREIFSDVANLEITENVRPTLEHENLDPARQSLLEVIQAKMQSSERYLRLGVPVTPSGYAVTRALEFMVRQTNKNTIIIDAGGAFTSVYSVIDGAVNRSVVDLRGVVSNGHNPELTTSDLMKWIPFQMSRDEVSAILGNRRLRPHTVPETVEELAVRLGIVREEIRLGLEQHKKLAVMLRGIQRKRQIWEVLGTYQSVGGQTLVDLTKVPNIVLTGGWLRGLSHAQIASVTLEGLQTTGINTIYVDRNSMLSALGMLAETGSIAEKQIADSLEPLCTCVSPLRPAPETTVLPVGPVGHVTVESPRGTEVMRLERGRIKRVPLAPGETAVISIAPGQGMDFGQGPGKRATALVTGGALGIVFDSRVRPFSLPSADLRRRAMLCEWMGELGVFRPAHIDLWQRSGQ